MNNKIPHSYPPTHQSTFLHLPQTTPPPHYHTSPHHTTPPPTIFLFYFFPFHHTTSPHTFSQQSSIHKSTLGQCITHPHSTFSITNPSHLPAPSFSFLVLSAHFPHHFSPLCSPHSPFRQYPWCNPICTYHLSSIPHLHHRHHHTLPNPHCAQVRSPCCFVVTSSIAPVDEVPKPQTTNETTCTHSYHMLFHSFPMTTLPLFFIISSKTPHTLSQTAEMCYNDNTTPIHIVFIYKQPSPTIQAMLLPVFAVICVVFCEIAF